MKKGMKATAVRSLLRVLLVILILVIAGGFYYGLEQIRTYAVEVSHTVADADASVDIVDEFRQLQKSLAEREALVDKATKIFTTDANYQSQALKDIQKYAGDLGIGISNTNFETPTDAAAASLGLGKTFQVTLQSPVSYVKLLQFLEAIEGNLPKMQIASISIGRTVSNTAGEVAIEAITIEIATR